MLRALSGPDLPAEVLDDLSQAMVDFEVAVVQLILQAERPHVHERCPVLALL